MFCLPPVRNATDQKRLGVTALSSSTIQETDSVPQSKVHAPLHFKASDDDPTPYYSNLKHYICPGKRQCRSKRELTYLCFWAQREREISPCNTVVISIYSHIPFHFFCPFCDILRSAICACFRLLKCLLTRFWFLRPVLISGNTRGFRLASTSVALSFPHE